MDIWSFGSPEDPSELEALQAAGVTTVVTTSAAPVAEQMGFATYSMVHTFPATNSEGDLAQDVWGRPVKWFSSACPNSPASRSLFFADLTERLQQPVDGIFLDGVRFSSFASSDLPSSFFSCFCPRCCQDMTAQGYDLAAIKRDVSSMARVLLHGPKTETAQLLKAIASPSGSAALTSKYPGLPQWLSYKARCIEQFASAVWQFLKDSGSRAELAGFLFEPALAYLVGQDYYLLSEHLSTISPMIYRNYPSTPGPAAINQEVLAVASFVASGSGLRVSNCIEAVARALGLPFANGQAELSLTPQGVVDEALAARALVRTGTHIAPIIWAGDPALAQTLELLADHDVTTCILFTYSAGMATHGDTLLPILSAASTS